jgi:hypothetical protein
LLGAVCFLAYRAARTRGVLEEGCAASSIAAIAVRPLADARTGAAIPDTLAEEGTLVVRDGAYADTTLPLIGAAPDRPGIYTVTVRIPGYLPWRRSAVKVRRHGCSVRTVYLRATLRPDPGVH